MTETALLIAGSPKSWTLRFIGIDPRIKICLGLLIGLLTWKSGPIGVILYGLALAFPLYTLSGTRPTNRSVIRAFAIFVIFWMAIKWLSAILEGANWVSALPETALLGLRLLVLLLLGLTLALSTQPRRMGLALSWFLQRFLGKKAWQLALAMALMIHFLPLVWETISTVRTTIALRASDLSRYRRTVLMIQATMRALSQKTWDQTLAIVARGLDSPEAWTANFPFHIREWTSALLIAVAATLAAWI
nr:hypothetical protein [uncultured Sphaerochaeta sp.]